MALHSKSKVAIATHIVEWDKPRHEYVVLKDVSNEQDEEEQEQGKVQDDEVFSYPARSLLHLSCENSGVSERQFNNDLLSIQRAHVTFDNLQRSKGEIRPHGFQIRIDSDFSLFHDRLGDPDPDQLNMGNKCQPNGTFGCTPTQLRVVKIVREAAEQAAKAQGKPVKIKQETRGQIGHYIPDWVVSSVAAKEPDPFGKESDWYRCMSMVGELKVTNIAHDKKTKKWTVVQRVEDDPSEDDDPESQSLIAANKKILIRLMNPDRPAVVGQDFKAKWQAGLAKLVVYMMTAYEYCGSFMGFAVIQTKCMRAIVIDDPRGSGEPAICFECNDVKQPTLVNLPAFLADQDNANLMPLELSQQLSKRDAENNPQSFKEDHLALLLKFIKASFLLLSRGSTKPPFDRISQIQNQCDFLNEVVESVNRNSVYAPKDDPLLEAAIRLARGIAEDPPTPQGGPKSSGSGQSGRGDGASGSGSGRGGAGSFDGRSGSNKRGGDSHGAAGGPGTHAGSSGKANGGDSKKLKQAVQPRQFGTVGDINTAGLVPSFRQLSVRSTASESPAPQYTIPGGAFH